MNASFLSRLFEMSYAALFRNLDGVTHDDSLKTPQPAGNTLNWVLGHIVSTRNRLLAMLGAQPVWPAEHTFFYSGRDEAQWGATKAFHLDALKTDLARSQQQLMAAFDALPPNALGAPTESGQTLAEAVGFFAFHESYHGGQIALLRRLAGRQGAIKIGAAKALMGARAAE